MDTSATKFRERFGKFGSGKKSYKHKNAQHYVPIFLSGTKLTQFGIELLQYFDATTEVDEARPHASAETRAALFRVVAIFLLRAGKRSARRRRDDARHRMRDARPEETLARLGISRGLDGGQVEESRQGVRGRRGGGGQGEVGLLLLLTLRLRLARRSTGRHIPGHRGRGRAAGRWEGHGTVSMQRGMGQ